MAGETWLDDPLWYEKGSDIVIEEPVISWATLAEADAQASASAEAAAAAAGMSQQEYEQDRIKKVVLFSAVGILLWKFLG